MDRVMAAAREPDYRECIALVLGEMYALGGHVQIDEREACTWLDCWDASLLMYVGCDGTRVLRLRGDAKALTELLRVDASEVAP